MICNVSSMYVKVLMLTTMFDKDSYNDQSEFRWHPSPVLRHPTKYSSIIGGRLQFVRIYRT